MTLLLVAVVVAFFICWAPFHAQRLMTLYVTNWNARLLEIQGHLFYLSGILYFFSSTVNPILYNVMSRKFRRAFKRTLCRCFVGANNLPSFYMLKAKFINHDLNVPHSRESDIPNMSDNKDFRIVTYYNNDKQESSKYNHSGDKYSTKETLINKTYESSSGKSHAHSDSDLHALCRHKRCSDRRHSALNRRRNGLVNSFHDIDDLRKEHTLFDYQTAAKLRLLEAEPLTHSWQSTV
ncbi:hypothetical protein DPMN_191354 [Dreissena polymorpha]|uniref:G-protein coupled receptors family 1 profile domain-containing protein n=1 Tax=Dreissena polymorpha TaxID=45954 RepID=A0A9D3Y454_DREPO|nr:hypothetical protein DPMN_191354 [Dreissena polymorpha]